MAALDGHADGILIVFSVLFALSGLFRGGLDVGFTERDDPVTIFVSAFFLSIPSSFLPLREVKTLAPDRLSRLPFLRRQTDK